MTELWRKPYRSIDASGSPESAGAVAWEWINQQAEEAKKIYGEELLSIEIDGGVTVLYWNCSPIAVATIFRDIMNFSVLVRWVA